MQIHTKQKEKFLGIIYTERSLQGKSASEDKNNHFDAIIKCVDNEDPLIIVDHYRDECLHLDDVLHSIYAD